MSVTTAADELANVETREATPAHFLIKIESFSLLEKCGMDKYETREFSAGEYKWKLIIYPDGDDDKTKDCNDYISVHLAIANTSSLPANWEINVVFSIFLYNHISNNYLSSLGRTRRFLGMKSEWGIPKFISKKILLDPSNGYLINDSCVFGAEVFVIKSETVTECLYLKNVDIPYKRDWKIPNFSQQGHVWESEQFTAGDQKWKICLYPKGNGEATGRGVSIYLYYVGSESVKACYTIQIKNLVSDEHKNRISTGRWFSASNDNWGWGTFIEIASMNDPKKGFIVNDSCLLDVEISVLAVAKQ